MALRWEVSNFLGRMVLVQTAKGRHIWREQMDTDPHKKN
jgi:hypothetical protein